MLITKLMLRPDGHVDLYGRGHRYKDLTLFDAADLFEVGVDPATLSVGVETPCRFYAHYVESGKLNKAGNPYLDVERLEGENGHKPHGDGNVDSEILIKALRAIYAELHAIRVLLEGGPEEQEQVEDVPADVPEPEDVPEPSAHAHPLNEQEARRRFNDLAGPAIRAGQVQAEVVNELVQAVVKTGWRDALVGLEALLEAARASAEQVPSC